MPSTIGRDDALILFNTWAEDRALVRCDMRFDDFASCFDARVVSASNLELRLRSDDRRTELALRLRDDFSFAYNDTRDPPSAKYVRLVVIFYPYDGDPADADSITIGEIKEDHHG